MGRSVSTHRHAVETVFINPEGVNDSDDLQYLLEDIRDNVLREKFPSLQKCDRWQDREDHVIAENQRGEVSVSEYCGLVAICLAPRDPDNALDLGWCGQVAGSFRNVLHEAFKSSALVFQGHASNGEQFFSRIGKTVQESCVTSKEGVLW